MPDMNSRRDHVTAPGITGGIAADVAAVSPHATPGGSDPAPVADELAAARELIARLAGDVQEVARLLDRVQQRTLAAKPPSTPAGQHPCG